MLEINLDRNLYPTEHKAISNLLQIDQQITETNQWQQHQIHTNKTPRKIFPPRKLQCTKNAINQNNPSNQKLAQSSQISAVQSNPQNKLRLSGVRQKPIVQFNQSEYWNTRLNWMSPADRRAQLSHSKLSKKLSWQEVNGKKSGHIRYFEDDRNRQEEYRSDLIYGLLQQKQGGWQRAIDESSSIRSLKNNSVEIGRERRGKDQIGQYANRVSKGLIQQNMRQTLKKMYLRHHQHQLIDHSSAAKPSEHQRSTMVRQLLINLQNMKEVPSSHHSTNERLKLKAQSSQKQSVNRSSSKKVGELVHINLETQKIYCKARVINRWNGRKHLPINVK